MKLVNPPRRADQFVYHYTKCNSALAILSSKTLRFNSLDLMNDPREACEWEPIVGFSGSRDLDLAEWKQLSKSVSRMLRRNVVLSSFSLDDPKCTDMADIEAYGRRGFCLAPLWHHYSEKHEGVCLMFDRDLLDSAIRRGFPPDSVDAGAVHYTDSGFLNQLGEGPFNISLVRARSWDDAETLALNHHAKYRKELFFRKRVDWQHEREYRWLCWKCVEPSRFIAIENAAVGIVFGHRVSRENYVKLFPYCVSNSLDSATLTWRNGHPYLENIMQAYITHQSKRDQRDHLR